MLDHVIVGISGQVQLISLHPVWTIQMKSLTPLYTSMQIEQKARQNIFLLGLLVVLRFGRRALNNFQLRNQNNSIIFDVDNAK